MTDIVKAAKKLIDSVEFDMNGAGGKGGNGGLLSDTTLRAAHDLRVIAQLNAIVDAWEALPGGRQVRNSDVEAWLGKHMAPAINAIRAFLSRPLPEGA